MRVRLWKTYYTYIIRLNVKGEVNIVEKKNVELWQAALGQLELSVSPASYNTWIKTLELGSIKPPVATIYTRNFMSKNYVEHTFYTNLLDVLSQINPQITQLKFTVNNSSSNKSDKYNKSTLFSPDSQSQDTNPLPPVNQDKPEIQKTTEPIQTGLQAGYTFETFIVGSSNRLAFSAAQLVVEKPGEAYNPLFLYGPAGVGKTHLMWAIRNEITKLKPDFSSHYITSETFTHEYVNAIRKGEEFSNKYREVDLLFVDDMQFIAGKEKTQEEFFHTFNALHQNAKQIVLCSDRPPKEIPTLEERLRSRFEWGLVADINPPDLETRIAIVLNKAARQNINLDEQVAEYIAHSVEKNIRELEGALTKIIAYCKANQTDLTLEVAKEVFGEISQQKPQLSAASVIEKTARFYNLNATDILGVKRDKEIVLPRQIVMYLLRTNLNLSYPRIATQLGGKDHTTIMHGSKKIDKLLDKDTSFKKEFEELNEFINSSR